MVEPISKRKLAWETTEEGKTTIGVQHVHEIFNNLNTKQQRRELEKTKQVDPSKLGFFQTNE
jgi:flagellar motor switch protein FliG